MIRISPSFTDEGEFQRLYSGSGQAADLCGGTYPCANTIARACMALLECPRQLLWSIVFMYRKVTP